MVRLSDLRISSALVPIRSLEILYMEEETDSHDEDWENVPKGQKETKREVGSGMGTECMSGVTHISSHQCSQPSQRVQVEKKERS